MNKIDEQEQKILLRIKKNKEYLKKIQDRKKRLQYGEILNICKEQDITLQDLMELAKKETRFKKEAIKNEEIKNETKKEETPSE